MHGAGVAFRTFAGVETCEAHYSLLLGFGWFG